MKCIGSLQPGARCAVAALGMVLTLACTSADESNNPSSGAPTGGSGVEGSVGGGSGTGGSQLGTSGGVATSGAGIGGSEVAGSNAGGAGVGGAGVADASIGGGGAASTDAGGKAGSNSRDAGPPGATGAGVLTYQYDNARDGLNPHETILTPAVVGSASFGLLFSRTVDDAIFAQPLYVPNVEIAGKGKHNVVYVVTKNDSVYAFDAESNAGANAAPLWTVNLLSGATGSANFPDTGIIGTPVIDVGSGTLFLVATRLVANNRVHRLHALDITSGAERPNSPVIIGASVPGTCSGAGACKFLSNVQYERASLLLIDRTVYTAWSDFDSSGNPGWLIAYDASTLAQTGAWATAPTGIMDSIWMSGAGPAADVSGNIYVGVGNGPFDVNAGGKNYGDSMVKLDGSLRVVDFFTPHDQANMEAGDADFGGGGPMLLPDSVGSASHPHLMASVDKGAALYLIDSDNLGKFNPTASSNVQTCCGGGGNMQPVYFNNTIFTSQWRVLAWSIANGVINTSAASISAAMNQRVALGVSSNGTKDGILWAQDNGGGMLYALNPANLTQIYFTHTYGTGTLHAWTPPTIVNGKVYVSASGTLAVFGTP
jgi:hypothetical protein